ncbi:MAG: sigma-70 family RNA polymerase sigma factor [Kofleriaceae bacterium]|nr:sigma-70 family RNA polymerase sigma factor [Kofleriaceae bacterium]
MTDDLPDIDSLIHQAQYREALSRLADIHGRAVGRLCMAMLGDQSIAEDVAQETFLAAYKGMKNYRAEGSLRAWLFGIARRQCVRRLERGPRKHLELVEDKHESENSTDGDMLGRRRSLQLSKELSLLKPSERDVLLMRFAGDLSFKEVANELNLSEASARKRASRALLKLRERMEPGDVE